MRSFLTDLEKTKIYTLVEQYENQQTKIDQEVVRSKDTIKSFYNRFEEYQTLSDDLQDGVTGNILADHNQNLRDVALVLEEFNEIVPENEKLTHKKNNYHELIRILKILKIEIKQFDLIM